MEYKVEKHPLTFYWDYIIEKGKCYIIQELKDNRVQQNFICNTKKEVCENIFEQDGKIIINI